MFIHPQPPTAQPFEEGYVRYIRLLMISNSVMTNLWSDYGVRMGQHVEYNGEGNVVVKLFLLGLNQKDQRVSSQFGIALVSSLSSDFAFRISKRDEPESEYRFAFEGQEDESSMTADIQIAQEIANISFMMIAELYTDPKLDHPEPVNPIQTASDGSFMKRVESVKDVGQSSNYVAHFSDGTAIRYTMPTAKGSQVKPGDWLHSDPRAGLEHIQAARVH